jgi:hypothetical protein
MILALLLVALLAPALLGLLREEVFWPTFWTPTLVPVGLALEAFVHLILLLRQRQVRTASPIIAVTLLLMALRFLGCAMWAPLVAEQGGNLGSALMSLWVGSPLVMFLQVVVLVTVLPVALSVFAPGFLGPRALARMTQWDREMAKLARSQLGPVSPPRRAANKRENLPQERDHSATSAAPFLYSYTDLERYMEKVIGVEGFVILNDEGLPVWSRAPWQIGIEDLGGDLSRWLLAVRPLVTPAAGSPQGAMVHSGDHWIVAQPLPGNAMLSLFITSRHTGEQVVEIASRVTQSVASLFAHRYPG